MELRSLQTFIQVAETDSFTRAAARMGYSQPTVSFQIRQLEKELNAQLFDRVGHTVRLTDRGRELLPQTQRICQLCQEIETAEQTEPSGLVRIGMADSLCSVLVSSSFADFRAAHPNIAVSVITAGTTELFRLLDHNEVDLVCTLDSHIYSANYIVANEEKIGVHFVVSTADPLAQKEFLTKEDLLSQTFLLTEKGMSYRRLLDEWLARDSRELQPVLEIGSANLLCRLVEQGIGISFLPDYVTADAVRRGTVKRLSAAGFEPDLWKQLLCHREKWISQPIRAVLTQLSAQQLAHLV